MADTGYQGVETASSLLISYEVLALALRKFKDREEINAKRDGRAPDEKVNYNFSFALLIINASIVEGTCRSIIAEQLLHDITRVTDEARELDKINLTRPRRVLSKYHSEIETRGGWDKLKEQYSAYFDKSLSKAVGKDVYESIETLFLLRNVFAHGTTIVHPKIKMDETMKDLYPYDWQRKLQKAAEYLEKSFGKGDIFSNLAEYSLPEHFLEKTKELFLVVEKNFGPLPTRAAKTVKMLKDYRFGYIRFTG
jgi:hypothetical protein